MPVGNATRRFRLEQAVPAHGPSELIGRPFSRGRRTDAVNEHFRFSFYDRPVGRWRSRSVRPLLRRLDATGENSALGFSIDGSRAGHHACAARSRRNDQRSHLLPFQAELLSEFAHFQDVPQEQSLELIRRKP